MSDANLRQIRVLHIVSAGALASSLQQSLFMPLLTRLPRPRVKSLVACLSPGAVPSAVLRQSGVPTYDLPISRKRFSPRAFQELQQATRNFRPDVIQAWGHTAQIISALLRPRCEWKPKLIWSISETAPLAKDAGVIDRQKLKYAAKFSKRADRVVYSSEAAASAHRRVGFPEGEHETIPPGVDATRFKPDFAARRKLREQLNLPGETFVIGMYAPFQPEYDYSTLIKAIGELIKINPNVAVVLAGHGVQKGNAPLMALVGGGALATRVHLLGEWSDISALYNACDVVCSSALNDQARMNIVMAMLCGVPCVATGLGAQGEVIGQHGVAIEAGNPAAFVKGITRVMQMPPEKRTFMAQGARKHALANYVYVRSLQKYLQLYYDSIGRQSLVTQDLPAPEVDPTLTVPPALPTEAELNAAKRKQPMLVDLSDPDSLESKVTERDPEELPKWRIEQEQERSKREAELAEKVAATKSSGDVLQVFEAQTASASTTATPMTERARGVADDVEELLSPDLLATDAPAPPRASNAPSGSRKNTNAAPTASSAPQPDAAKQAALKAARMAALQPIAPPPKRPSAVKPVAAGKAAPAVTPLAASAMPSIDFNSTQPVELLSSSELLQASPSPAATQRVETLAKALAQTPVGAPADKRDSDTIELISAPAQSQSSAPVETVLANAAAAPAAEKMDRIAAPSVQETDSSTTQPLSALDGSTTQPLESLPESDLATSAQVPTAAAPAADVPAEKVNATANAQPPARARESELSLVVETPADPTTDKVDAGPSPLGRLAKALAIATIPPLAPASLATTARSSESRPTAAPSPIAAANTNSAPATNSMTAALEKWNSSFDLGELSLMATGMWAAAPRSDAGKKPEAPKSDVLTGAEALSLISEPTETSAGTAPKVTTVPVETKRAANGE